MIINGREIGFTLTVGAQAELIELFGNDFAQTFENLSVSEQIRKIVEMIVVLNKGYEDKKTFIDRGYVPKYLLAQEVLSLDNDEFLQLQKEAMSVFKKQNTIEVEPTEKK